MNDACLDSVAAERARLRGTLSKFATGVTIITAVDSDGLPFGMTANSFTSVSLDPPLVLWNLGRDATCYERMRMASRFVINFLTDDQQDLSKRFAMTALDKFADIAWSEDAYGCPELDGCLGYLNCKQRELIDAGDHLIVLADVIAHRVVNTASPMVFYDGAYRALI